MAAKPVKVAFLADTADLRSSLSKAEAAMDDAASTAKTAGAKIDSAFDSTASHADDVASKGSQAAGALSGLGDLIGGPWGAAMQGGGVAMQAMADAGDLVNVVTESAIVKKAKDIVVTTAQRAATVAQTVAQKALNAAMRANPIGLIITAITLLVGALVVLYRRNEAFRNLVDAVWGKVKAIVSGVAGWIRDNVPPVFDKIRDKVEAVVNGVRDKFDGLLGFVKGLPGRITDATSNMWDGITDAFRGAINAVIRMWNDLSFHLDLPNGIPGLPDSITINTPNIPELAQGGIVTRPTLALIGEAGPEAVIPLNGRQVVGDVYQITVHTPVGGSSEDIARTLARYLGDGARKGVRRRA